MKGLGLVEAIQLWRHRTIVINHDAIYACDPAIRDKKFNYLVNQQLVQFRANQFYVAIIGVTISIIAAFAVMIILATMSTIWIIIAMSVAIIGSVIIAFVFKSVVIATMTKRSNITGDAIDPVAWESFSSRDAKPITIHAIKQRIETLKDDLVPKEKAKGRQGISPASIRVVILKHPGDVSNVAVASNVFVIDGSLIAKYENADMTGTIHSVAEKWMALGRDNANKVFYHLVNRAMYMAAWKHHMTREFWPVMKVLSVITAASVAAWIILFKFGVSDPLIAFLSIAWGLIPVYFIYTRYQKSSIENDSAKTLIDANGIDKKLVAYLENREVTPLGVKLSSLKIKNA